MRIMLINKYWRPAGGVENHAIAVKEMLERRGHEVIPFAMSESSTWQSDNNDVFPKEVDFRTDSVRAAVSALSRAVISRDSTVALGRLIDRVKPDVAYVLHVYHQLGPRVLNVLADRQIPTVHSIHDYKVACGNYRFFSERTNTVCMKCIEAPGAHAYRPALERCWNGSSKAGIALSIESIAARARDSYSRVNVITTLNSLQENALDAIGNEVPRIRVPHPVVLRPTRPSENRRRFLFIGRAVPEKGLLNLISAVAAARVELTVVGDGRSLEEARLLASRLEASVDFRGALPHAEAIGLLRESIALCVPSIWHEVSPLVVLEAISEDVPVIASRLGGMVDQLEDGRGYLIPPDDSSKWTTALQEVASAQHAAQARSAAARQYASMHWTHDHWMGALLEAFEMAGVEL